MPINIANFVDITSGVGAGASVPTRNLGALIISANPLVPTGELLSFENAEDVGTYFGTAGEDYARAEFYFGFVSKNITSPQQLSFYFWNNDAATGSLIFGAPPISSLAQFNTITTGDFTLTLGGTTFHLTGVSFSAAGSLAAVASELETAIQAHSAGGMAWTAATVAYDATTGAFNLTSGATGADTVAIVAGSIEDMAGPLGWLSAETVLSNGSAAQTLPAALAELAETDNNFGSFCLSHAYNTEANVLAAATWNYSLTPNFQFLFTWVVTAANASAWQTSVAGLGGQCGQLASPNTAAFPEMEPMMIFAATDYTRPNAVQNFMYQQFNDTASVTTDAQKATYDALRINYYGQTQTAGQNISFFQDGVISGGQATDPSAINVYCNEIWFKDAIAAQVLTLLLVLSQLPANASGRAQLLSQIQSVIQIALINGTISVGKTLNNTQKLYISEVTGNPTAWQQVQSSGWWLDAAIESYVQNSITKYKAVYTLVYSKDDTIGLVQGSDILI